MTHNQSSEIALLNERIGFHRIWSDRFHKLFNAEDQNVILTSVGGQESTKTTCIKTNSMEMSYLKESLQRMTEYHKAMQFRLEIERDEKLKAWEPQTAIE